jgi:hypothetical protein
MKRMAPLLVLAVLAWSSLTSAQQASVENASRLRNEGRFEEARTMLAERKRTEDTPRVALELGLTLMALGRFAEAEAELTYALEARSDAYVTANRRAIELALRLVERHVGTVEVVTNAERATIATSRGTVAVEGGRAALRLDEGRHRLAAAAEGFLPLAREVSVRAGELVSVEMSLTPEPKTVAREPCPVDAMSRPVEGGACCWPGQSVTPDGGQCVGAPRCPAGYVAEGATCVAPAPWGATRNVPVGGTFVLNGTYSRFVDGSVRLFRETTDALPDDEVVRAIDHLFGFNLRAGYRMAPAFALTFSLRGMAAKNVTWLESLRGASSATRDDIAWTAYAHESGLMFELHTSRTRRAGMIDVAFAAGPHYARLWLVPDTDNSVFDTQDVASVEAITLPMEVSISFYVSRGFAFNLFGGATPWIPITYRGEEPETQVNYELSRGSLRAEWSYTVGAGFTVQGGRDREP